MDDEDAADAAIESPASTATIAHPRHEAADKAPPRIVHPPAYRLVVAGWSETWRERWGRRANELEDSGLNWRDAETQAFVEILNQRARQASPEDASAAGSDPERN